MKLTFNKHYFITSSILLIIEVLIAAFLKDGFIRHTVGDFLVVILMYCFLRSFLKTKVLSVAITTLAIAYIVEFLQLTDFLNSLGVKHNKWANLILGSTFSIQDIFAYTMGIVVVVFADTRLSKVASFRNVNG